MHRTPAASTCLFRTTWPGLGLDVLAASWDPHNYFYENLIPTFSWPCTMRWVLKKLTRTQRDIAPLAADVPTPRS